MVLLIQVIDFIPARENIFMLTNLFFGQLGTVMFIFYFTDDLFDKVLKGYNAAGTTKFIHHDSNAFMFTDEQFHKFVCRHGCRYNGHVLYEWFNLTGVQEE